MHLMNIEQWGNIRKLCGLNKIERTFSEKGGGYLKSFLLRKRYQKKYVRVPHMKHTKIENV